MRTNVGTVEDLHASAVKACALTDFGERVDPDDDYRTALAVLLDSYARDAGLTELGSKMSRFFLRGALIARAVSQASRAALGDEPPTPIQRPVFITGLPRSGTTALHRLLAADPAHQALELWLVDFPQPRPPRETWPDNPVYRQIEAGLAQHGVENPEFMGLHYMSPTDVEECWQLLRQSMLSVSFESLAHLPTYSRWLQTQDWVPAYRRHRFNLEILGHGDSRRWVLKNPSHLFALDALLEVYPDAAVIQTHRRPQEVIASACSLSEHATKGWSTTFVGETVGQDQLELWARGLESFRAARARHSETLFLDVGFAELRADPFGVVEKIYAALGAPLSEAAHEAMSALDAESRAGDRRPEHRYRLSDYGLSEAAVSDRFTGLTAG
jgi:hypothetical protein